ncbi:GbsR/MarR family transcriptional regulator [Oceanobacillus sp. FSL H7-0719]|uniref:GbsR/MarR family transcriptional regulator n=1 Tax=Oceanobacillus sp. FSL H7-0719 TaxID=2954507 RepID=UPI003245B67F
MNTNNETLKDDLISAFSKTIEMFGLSTLESRLFAYLYLTNQPQTLDEMSEALGKSKTAMSTSIRSLSNLNLVSQVWKKGVRKDLYIANSQLFKVFVNFYIRKWVDKTARQKETLEELKDITDDNWTGTDDEEERAQILNRVDEIIDFHSSIESAFNELRVGKK